MIDTLPRELMAATPAELRGLRRDGARLAVVDTRTSTVAHTVVADLARLLEPGDLLVVNSSRTIPAALTGTRSDGSRVQVRPWVRRPTSWDAIAVEPQPPFAPLALEPGELLRFPAGFATRVAGRRDDLPSLWRLVHERGDALATLLAHGEAIRYSYVPVAVPFEHLQTVYATVPGSAETPSAGRHLTWELLLELRRRGVAVTDIVLHTGLSSTQDDDVDATHPLVEEWYAVSELAATAIRAARRVIAVGTSVVRALETAADADGQVRANQGWTSLRIQPGARLRVCDALLSGLHEPSGSHLDVVGAFAGRGLLERAYEECAARRYLWHEFGDAMLIR